LLKLNCQQRLLIVSLYAVLWGEDI